jgi:hypothetical protein
MHKNPVAVLMLPSTITPTYAPDLKATMIYAPDTSSLANEMNPMNISSSTHILLTTVTITTITGSHPDRVHRNRPRISTPSNLFLAHAVTRDVKSYPHSAGSTASHTPT